LSKEDRGREKKKWSCGKDKWISKVIISGKNCNNNYEEFIDEGLQSERTTMEGRIIEKRC